MLGMQHSPGCVAGHHTDVVRLRRRRILNLLLLREHRECHITRNFIHPQPTASTSTDYLGPRPTISSAIDSDTNLPSAKLSENVLHPRQPTIRLSLLLFAVAVLLLLTKRGGNDRRRDEFLCVRTLPTRTPATDMRCGCEAESTVRAGALTCI